MRISLASLRRQATLAAGVAKIKQPPVEYREMDLEIACLPKTYLPGLRGADRNLPRINQTVMEKAVAEMATAWREKQDCSY